MSTDIAAMSAENYVQQGEALENLLHENRKFAPSAEFAANAVTSADAYAEAEADRPAFWAKQARELLTCDVWLLGRVDDVMNVSGHRLSTTEIESALVSHPSVAEAAVVGAADDTTGQAVVAFVILRGDAVNNGDETVLELRNHVGKEIGPIAKPKQLLIVPELPKTRSGKIVRRLLKDIAEGRDTGDATTLADPGIMAQIAKSLTK
ncbi:hypothetical protein ARTHRO9V_240138 [Arthrobacter sp. 9V]|nr:hypothetical protein ARTHRO9V_240138 [Arthrobacter sp. 9V]